MSSSQHSKVLFARGFELAWFIHLDRDQAWEVASSALVQLETTVINWKKYVDYSVPQRRTKVHLLREQVYQYLILRRSAELQAEELKRNSALSEDTMLIFFYSFIACRLFRTNSFRANACIGRLLLRLSVEETRCLYGKLRPSYRDTDDSEYSREKQIVYGDLMERFAERVVPVTLARNEKSFAPHDSSGEFQGLAEECWKRFAPWSDVCPLADRADDRTQLESLLESESAEAEQNRMHIIMHCLRRFAQSVLGEAPEMLIPHFVVATSGGDPGGDLGNSLDRRLSPPPLAPLDNQRLIRKLADARLRRRTTLATLLQCKIDGRVKAEIDLRRESQSVPMTLSAEDDCVEVWANDVLLATYFLPDVETLNEGQPVTQSVELEGGQQLICNLVLVTDSDGALTVPTAHVQYRETSALRAAVRWWQRFKHQNIERINCSPVLVNCSSVLARLKTSVKLTPCPGGNVDGNIFSAWRVAVAVVVTALLISWVLLVNGPGWDPKIVTAPSPTPFSPTPEPSINPSPNVAAPTLLALTDGDRRITLDAQGSLTGLDWRSPADRQRVTQALQTGRVETPPELARLRPSSGTLMGGGDEAGFALLDPVGKIVLSDRPTLRWGPLDGAASYSVTITDPAEHYREVAVSPPITRTRWTVDRSLKRGHVYAWMVTARTGEKEVRSPAARFKVLERTKADELSRVREVYAGSHLTLGLLYAQAGLLDEAEGEFMALAKANPQVPVVKSMLRDLRAKMRAR